MYMGTTGGSIISFVWSIPKRAVRVLDFNSLGLVSRSQCPVLPALGSGYPSSLAPWCLSAQWGTSSSRRSNSPLASLHLRDAGQDSRPFLSSSLLGWVLWLFYKVKLLLHHHAVIWKTGLIFRGWSSRKGTFSTHCRKGRDFHRQGYWLQSRAGCWNLLALVVCFSIQLHYYKLLWDPSGNLQEYGLAVEVTCQIPRFMWEEKCACPLRFPPIFKKKSKAKMIHLFEGKSEWVRAQVYSQR